MTKFLVVILLFCCQTMAYGENSGNTTLDNFYQSVQSLRADFDQTVHNSRGKILEQSSGHLIISRPDKFILNYQTPALQKYISNGNTIWIYDAELEQVNIKALDEGVGDSPALLLSSNANIYDHYRVEDVNLDNGDDYHWLQFTARSAEMTFERVLLAFKDNTLVQLTMYDSFGQVTQLKFSNIVNNQHFPEQQFHFQPPPGVDVIGAADAQ